jgi:GT2 family glycosyltransferase
MATSLEVFDRVGFFDEDPRLSTAEDCEWAYRVVRAGVSITYLPDAVVHHLAWRDKGERSTQYADYARSHGGFYGKYLRRGDFLIGLRVLVHHLRALRRWVHWSLKGDPEQASIGRAYLTGLLPGILQRKRE